MLSSEKRTGKNPISTTEKETLFGVLLTDAILLWFVLVLLYIFNPQSVNWLGKISALDNDVIQIIGIAMISFGFLVAVRAARDLGDSFRLALPEEKTKLVTIGIYDYVRNPMVLFMDVFAIASFLIIPNLLCLIVVIVNIVGYDAKVRGEEKYLSRMHGEEYDRYVKKVGRYFPNLLGKGCKNDSEKKTLMSLKKGFLSLGIRGEWPLCMSS